MGLTFGTRLEWYGVIGANKTPNELGDQKKLYRNLVESQLCGRFAVVFMMVGILFI